MRGFSLDIEKIKSIRKSLGDYSEDETARLFTDEEINEVLNNYGYSDYKVLYVLHLQKAGRLITNENFIKSIKAGNEELERLNASELQAMALKQAEEYRKLFELEKENNEESSFLY